MRMLQIYEPRECSIQFMALLFCPSLRAVFANVNGRILVLLNSFARSPNSRLYLVFCEAG